MIVGMDHFVVIVRDVAAAAAAYETLMGLAPAWRQQGEGSQSVMFTTANTTLELLGSDDNGAGSERLLAALDQQGEGLASLAFRVGDIGRMHRRLARLGLEPEPVAAASGVDVASGTTLEWQRTRAATAATHGVRMFFLELGGERPVSAATTASPLTGLDHVVIQTPAPDRAAALYGARLGLDMALDRTSSDWGARLMFFRCGDLIIEIAHNLKIGIGDGPDRIWGLSWRAADLDATRERLVAAGVDVSEVRSGRKPGTRVDSVRSGTCGVPTLLIEPAKAQTGG